MYGKVSDYCNYTPLMANFENFGLGWVKFWKKFRSFQRIKVVDLRKIYIVFKFQTKFIKFGKFGP